MHNIMNKIKTIRKKNIILMLLSVFVLSLCVSYCFSYYYTSGNLATVSYNINIPNFAPKVNGSYNLSQSIDLSSTITNNKNLAPGAEGKFKIDIDLSEVETDVYYRISYDRTNIPNNLHFYVDEEFTSELNYINGVEVTSNTNRVVEHYIYWRWILDNSETSNQNDSLYMGQSISVPFTTIVSQQIEEHATIINNYEIVTGRVNLIETHTGSNLGSFSIDLDLTGLTPSHDYYIYFGKNELSSNLHLYSDSSYQNEINNISVIYDGENTNVTKTIYWRLDNDNISTLSDGLYYIFY